MDMRRRWWGNKDRIKLAWNISADGYSLKDPQKHDLSFSACFFKKKVCILHCKCLRPGVGPQSGWEKGAGWPDPPISPRLGIALQKDQKRTLHLLWSTPKAEGIRGCKKKNPGEHISPHVQQTPLSKKTFLFRPRL